VPAKILNQRHFFFGFTSGCGNGGGTAELFSVTFLYEVSGVGLFGLVGTFRTWRDVWFEFAMRTTTDI
jgi:hypothetical protein